VSVHIASPCPRLPPPCDTLAPTAPAPCAMAAPPAAAPTAPPTAVLPPRSRRPHPLYLRRVPTSVSLPCSRMDPVITVPPPQLSCTPAHGPSPRRAPAHGSRPHPRSDTSPAVSLPTDPSDQDSSDAHVSCPRLSLLVPLPERRLHLQPVVPRREGKRTMARPISRSSRTRISLA
jgi:hypothetical protein